MTVIDSTWTWRQLAPATPPTARHFFEMCYDPVGQRTLLYGGFESGVGAAGDMWELVGEEWNEIFPANTPGDRFAYSMCMDDANARLLLYGGSDGVGLSTETWEYASADWTELFPADDPSDLLYGNSSVTVQTYDAINGYPALIQGDTAGGAHPFTGEATMVFTGGNWVRLTLTDELFEGASFPNAYPRSNISLCSTSEGLQVDGGGNPQPADWNDTWKLPGGLGPSWLEALAYSYPPAAGRWGLREGHRTIWTGDQVFLFSGAWESTAGAPGPDIGLTDSWLYDLTTWDEIVPAGGPPPSRTRFGMVWDPDAPRVIVFGGQARIGAGVARNDTWVLEPPTTAAISHRFGLQ